MENDLERATRRIERMNGILTLALVIEVIVIVLFLV